MNRSLAALTLALLVSFGSTAYSSSSEITDTYPVDCSRIIDRISTMSNLIKDIEEDLIENPDNEKKVKLYEEYFPRWTGSQADLAIIYNTFCK